MTKEIMAYKIANCRYFDGSGYYTYKGNKKEFVSCNKNYYRYSEEDTIKELMKLSKEELKDLIFEMEVEGYE